MIDNFEQIKQFISICDTEYPLDLYFDKDPDSFYQVQLIKRKKDNPDMKGDCLVFKRYYINKKEDLDKYKDEIILMCNTFNLRAYFMVDRKSYRQATLDSMVEIAQRVQNNDFKKIYAVVDSCIGKYANESHKKWVIDIDAEDCPDLEKFLERCVYYVNYCCNPGHTVITTIKTKSGFHIITNPFDLRSLTNYLGVTKDVSEFVKKKASTILYA